MPARLRLNLFSPLPPQQSEVANHTLTVAAALSAHADVTLWTAQPEPTKALGHHETALGLPVVHFDPASMDWPRFHAADTQIYNLGNNNPFHAAIFEVAAQAPGIMVLHDTRLQHFFAYPASHSPAGRHTYLARLRRSHGAAAVADAAQWLDGREQFDTLVQRYPMTAAAADVALAAIVHNQEECHRLTAQTRVPVFYLPLASAAAPPLEPAPRDGAGRLRLVVFGHLGLNRRLPALLEAMASLPDLPLMLDIFGVLEDAASLETQVAALGLAGQVRRHGFVPAETLRSALAQADLAINLRYPSMGEASASQLRIWEAALPAVVTRTGWYATLPADTVFFVDPEHEVADLRSHLQALQRDPERFRRAGRRGRAVLEAEHTPERYAEGLLAVAAQSPALHARRAALDVTRQAARAMMGLAGAEGVALAAAAAAKAAAALAGEAVESGSDAAKAQA